MSANITSCTRLGSWQRPRAPAPSVGRDACSVAGAAVIGTDRDARGTRPAEIVAFTAIELMAALHYLRGTNVGGEPTEQHPRRRLPGPNRIPSIVVHLRGAQVDSERGGLPSGQDLALKAEAWKSPGLFGVAEKR